MDLIQIINIIAIIASPIVAVVVGQALQNQSVKRKDKMHVFELLHNNISHFLRLFTGEGRDKAVEEAVLGAIGMVPIVYNKDKTVLDAFKTFKVVHDDLIERVIKRANLPKDEDAYLRELRTLIVAIVKNLGYKDYSPFMYSTKNPEAISKVKEK
ncbi:MAG: hypothetical protein FWC73_11050 [Defluviitaleaceae bacterium]|nr:hypothetical protein [Defluviitaleaceae bacterium]